MEVFFSLVQSHGIQPMLVCIQDILDYLIHLKSSLSFLRVHLAAILAFHSPILGKSISFNSMVVQVLKSIVHLFPPVKEAVQLWNLNTVLAALIKPPFGPQATCSLSLLPKNSFSYCHNIHKESKQTAGSNDRASTYTIFQRQRNR